MEKNLFASIKTIGRKKFLAFLILAAIDFLTIGVPYYFRLLVPNIQNYLGVEEADVSRMIALIGSVTFITQLSGGYLTDKFSSKKLLISSVVITATVMFWFAGLILFHEGYSVSSLRYQYYIIYTIWGISSTPLFWAPLWKLVSQQVGKEKQGFAFGLQGALNGFVGFILFCIFGFSVLKYTQWHEVNILKSTDTSPKYWSTGFGIYIFFLAAILFISALGIHLYVQERKTSEKLGLSLIGLSRTMCNWKVWGLSIFLLGMYMFQSPIAYYLFQMLANVNKLDPTLLLVIPILRIFVLRFAISIPISRWSDRIKSFIFLLIWVCSISVVIMIITILMPGISFRNGNYFDTLSNPSKIIVSTIMVVLFLMIAALSWIMVALRYPQAQEINFPRNSFGTVTAVISFIGFSSDSWFYAIGSFIQEKYSTKVGNKNITTQSGYQIILLLSIIFVLIGLIAGFLVWNSERKLMRTNNLQFARWRGLNND